MKQKLLVPVVAVFLALSMLGLIVSNFSATTSSAELSHAVSTLSANNDALRAQVKSLGKTPVAPPASTVTDDLPKTGAQGPPGQAGNDGRTPTGAEIYAQVAAYCQYSFCVGPQGPPGIGQNGADGAPGQNGTTGADGQSITGPAGTPGTNGTDGQPPYSWRYTTAAGIPVLCARDTPFDPTQPTYTCAPVAPIP